MSLRASSSSSRMIISSICSTTALCTTTARRAPPESSWIASSVSSRTSRRTLTFLSSQRGFLDALKSPKIEVRDTVSQNFVEDARKGKGKKMGHFEATRRYGNVHWSWGGAAFTVMFTMGVYCYFQYLGECVKARGKNAITKSETIGKPNLGGPFTLYDQNGKIVTDRSLRGKYLLLYFGFSFCPDICPEEMEKQRMVIEKLDELYVEQPVLPVFITCDPNRDTCAQVKAYCNEFHPRLLGLTGAAEQIKKVTRRYRVYYNEGIRTDDTEDYLVDHSIIHYFIDRNGKFHDFFGRNLTVDEIVDKIRQKINEDKLGKPM